VVLFLRGASLIDRIALSTAPNGASFDGDPLIFLEGSEHFADVGKDFRRLDLGCLQIFECVPFLVFAKSAPFRMSK
jgi:hypothetical protein